IVDAIVRELQASGVVKSVDPGPASTPAAPAAAPPRRPAPSPGAAVDLEIDLPDPTLSEYRSMPRVKNQKDLAGLRALMASTPARIGVGRAGPRYSTPALLLF